MELIVIVKRVRITKFKEKLTAAKKSDILLKYLLYVLLMATLLIYWARMQPQTTMQLF